MIGVHAPSIAQGYARSASKSAHPDLWRNLKGVWVPAFGRTGEILLDVSGDRHNGTLIDMDPPSSWLTGNNPHAPGYTLDFNGTANVVDVGDVPSLQILGDLSLVVSFNADAFGNNDALLGVGGSGETEATNISYVLSFPASNDIQYIHEFGAGSNFIKQFNTNFNTNQWYHIVFTRDSITKTVAFYIDGQFLESASFSTGPSGGETSTLRLGGSGHTTTGQFNGSMSLWMIYNRVLSLDDIQLLFNEHLAPFIEQRKIISRAPVSGLSAIIGQIIETDSAQVISWAPKNRLVDQIIETDLSQSVTVVTGVEIGQVTEVDLSQVIAWAPKHRLVGLITEVDLAQSLGRLKTVGIGQIVETDLSQGFSILKALEIGLINEVDLAQVVSVLKSLEIGQITEIDLSQITTAGIGLISVIGQVTEVDLAQSIIWSPKNRLVGLVEETDLAFALVRDVEGGGWVLRRRRRHGN